MTDAARVAPRSTVAASEQAADPVGRARSRSDRAAAGERPAWKAVAVPTEHGGWGLTAEPGLLGLLVAPSWAGLAIGLAAVVAFLLRTPLKLAVGDRLRGRSLPRTRLASRIAAAELAVLVVLAGSALALAGPGWLVPVALAVPLIAVELWFDVRSRGRRLVPELAGSIGVCSVAASVAVAGGASPRLAAALWAILAARAVATVAFARVEVLRFRAAASGRTIGTASSDGSQAAGAALAVVAVLLAPEVLLGAIFLGVVVIGELVVVRRPPIRPRVLGFTQLGIGLTLVALTAASVALI